MIRAPIIASAEVATPDGARDDASSSAAPNRACEQVCAKEAAAVREQMWRAQTMLFLTDMDRVEYFVEKQKALDTAARCQNDARNQLLTVALPKLEADCVASGNVPCANWARNQRRWRDELFSLQRASLMCNKDRARTAISESGE